MKNQKGVTLIALVITIIVLLILAGVSISTLMSDDGILTNANKAVENNLKSNLKEAVELRVSNVILAGYSQEDMKLPSESLVERGQFATGTIIVEGADVECVEYPEEPTSESVTSVKITAKKDGLTASCTLDVTDGKSEIKELVVVPD